MEPKRKRAKKQQRKIPIKKRQSQKRSKIVAPISVKKPFKIEDHHIPHLSRVHDLEEFYFVFDILNQDQSKLLLQHYKQSMHSHKDQEILKNILQKNKDLVQIKESLKKEILIRLTNECKEIAKKIEKDKKQGKDTLVDEFKLQQLPLKIKLFQTTGDKDDYYQVRRILSSITK